MGVLENVTPPYARCNEDGGGYQKDLEARQALLAENAARLAAQNMVDIQAIATAAKKSVEQVEMEILMGDINYSC